MDELLERARQVAEQAEVYSVTSEETPVLFEANRLKLVESRQSHGLALRIVKNGRLGFAAGTDVENLDALVQTAVEVAAFGAEAAFEFPGAQSYPQVALYDPAVATIGSEAMVELGQQMIDGLRAENEDLLCEASVGKRVSQIAIINSNGGRAAYQRSSFGISIEGTLIRGTDMLFVGDSASSCSVIGDVSPVVAEAVWQLRMAREIVSAPEGLLPVIFTPHGVAGGLLMSLLSAFNGRAVLQGASPLGHRLGEVVYDRRFSLGDDGTQAMRPGSRICDDEGVPTRRTKLVEQGRLVNFFYDLQTAGLARKESTGNGSRGLTTLPTPSPSVLVVEEGEVSFEEMVAGIREGLVVEQMLGAGQGNVQGGEFGGNVLLGFKIENGRIVGRVKDTMISGNIHQALKEVAGIGNRAKWVGGSVYVPHLCFPALGVSKKS